MMNWHKLAAYLSRSKKIPESILRKPGDIKVRMFHKELKVQISTDGESLVSSKNISKVALNAAIWIKNILI